jgi:hypothetical protein
MFVHHRLVLTPQVSSVWRVVISTHSHTLTLNAHRKPSWHLHSVLLRAGWLAVSSRSFIFLDSLRESFPGKRTIDSTDPSIRILDREPSVVCTKGSHTPLRRTFGSVALLSV